MVGLLNGLTKKAKFSFKIFLVLTFVCFCLQGCSAKTASSKISTEERSLLEKFFRYLLLNESGIYTLLGSKPVTEVYIHQGTLEEKKERWNRLSEKEKLDLVLIINQDDHDDMDFFHSLSNELKKKAILVPDEYYVLDLTEILMRWDIVERLPISQNFILKKVEISDQVSRITFVNVAETISVIERHYKIFHDAVGFDFDPFSVVMELKSGRSKFWETINKLGNHQILGLLYGFGEKNAHCFQLRYEGNNPFKGQLSSFPYQEFCPTPSIENFDLPSFISFSEEDPIVNRYIQNRTEIQHLYKQQNFLDFTLESLKGKPLK